MNGNLPSNTRKLLIEKKYPDDKISLLNNLPNDLKKLKLVNIDAKLDNLPCGLEVLELHGRMSYPLDYLPESLKTLILYKYDSKLNDLPVGLEKLFLMNEYYGNLCNLPYGLKFIHLYAPSHIPNIKLSPNIKCVNFNDVNYEDNIEKYTEKIQFVKFNNYLENYDDDSDDNSSNGLENYKKKYNNDFDIDKFLFYNNKR